MNKQLFPIAAVAVLCMTGTVSADEVGRYYAKVDVGHTTSPNQEVEGASDLLKGYRGFTGGLGLGYNISDIIRADITVQYSKLMNKRNKIPGSDVYGPSMGVSSFSSMVNVYYNFILGDSKFTPFITAGIGINTSLYQVDNAGVRALFAKGAESVNAGTTFSDSGGSDDDMHGDTSTGNKKSMDDEDYNDDDGVCEDGIRDASGNAKSDLIKTGNRGMSIDQRKTLLAKNKKELSISEYQRRFVAIRSDVLSDTIIIRKTGNYPFIAYSEVNKALLKLKKEHNASVVLTVDWDGTYQPFANAGIALSGMDDIFAQSNANSIYANKPGLGKEVSNNIKDILRKNKVLYDIDINDFSHLHQNPVNNKNLVYDDYRLILLDCYNSRALYVKNTQFIEVIKLLRENGIFHMVIQGRAYSRPPLSDELVDYVRRGRDGCFEKSQEGTDTAGGKSEFASQESVGSAGDKGKTFDTISSKDEYVFQEGVCPVDGEAKASGGTSSANGIDTAGGESESVSQESASSIDGGDPKVVSESRSETVAPKILGASSTFETKRKTSFAYQGGAGVSYKVNDRMAVDLSYNISSIDDGVFKSALNHTVIAGIRISF